ncbi:MAG: glycosyltransferase [Chitinophagaceae bacterium]|nr:glycosyltransferase [Chitinophagaceae bacterium]
MKTPLSSPVMNLNLYNLLLFVLGGVFIIQLFYYFYFFARLAFYTPKKKLKSQQHPVSVIICARNEDENLARNLPGVLVQHYPSTFEVIVVDDQSTDDTRYVLEQLKKTFRFLRSVEIKQEALHIPGKKYPLSVGVREARHEILLFTDADCVPASEHWIEKMQYAYEDQTEIVLGYGAYHKKKGMLNRFIRFETFHTAIQYLSYALAGIPYMGVGRNLSYRKQLFFRHKGFSSIRQIPGGDDDLFVNLAAHRHNTAVVIDPEAITRSVPKSSWKEWFRQKRRHYTTAKYYKPKHKFLLGLYALSHFLFYPLLVLCAVWYNWKIAIAVFLIRTITQWVIFSRCMHKLDEKDLKPWILFFDIALFFYYTIFSFSLFRKPAAKW